MSSFMIDENKNLVSDKLWEFFATPWSDTAPELNTIQNVEVGEVFQAICSGTSGGVYEWDRRWSDGEMFLFKLNHKGATLDGPYLSTSGGYKSTGIFQILQYRDGFNHTDIIALRCYNLYRNSNVECMYYKNMYAVGIRLS